MKIIPATQQNLAATNADPQWQTDWESEYLADPAVDKFAMKLADGELLALGAYQVSGRKAYVYILYVESAPQSNPTITSKVQREYYGIGEAMIAFGIKYSIDNGCRGDAVFDAKTDERAQHHAHDFGAKQIPSGFSGGPKRFMLAAEGAWNLFSKYLAAEAGGYFAPPAKEDMAYTELFFDVCEQFGIRYYSATKKERHFVEEVTRVTWAKQQEEKIGVRQDIRPAFSA